jgi:hypothetical protein
VVENLLCDERSRTVVRLHGNRGECGFYRGVSLQLTSMTSSPLINGAWNGRLVHLAGLDVVGATAGSLARLVQDREIELWEGKRVVAEATEDEVRVFFVTPWSLSLTTSPKLVSGELTVGHPSFRIISTASKSIPLKDWLSDEHANMFFSIPSCPMPPEEETSVLLETGCPTLVVRTLLSFASSYRASMSGDDVQKNRKLGTRSLVRIARRLAQFPQDGDLGAVIGRSLLADFLPAAERVNLDALQLEAGISRKPPLVCCPPSGPAISLASTHSSLNKVLSCPHRARECCSLRRSHQYAWECRTRARSSL